MLEPVPVMAPGLIVQFPAGNPFKTTLPVATAQVGWVMTPTMGADGVAGCALITMAGVGKEVHPIALVTVKVYEPATNPDLVYVDPEPDIAPGLIIQFPEGNPFNTTLPVETEHVGCVIVPTPGVEGVEAIITTLAVGKEVHPAELVTVKL